MEKVKTFFKPKEGQLYVLGFLGKHAFTIDIGNSQAHWYQRSPVYPLIFGFNIIEFDYIWVAEMSYNDYLKRCKDHPNDPNYQITIKWQKDYKDTELETDGTPKDKTQPILVQRKEKMNSLRKIELYKIAVQFETLNKFRGSRIFTLFLQINDLSEVIRRTRDWQEVAAAKFAASYNAWASIVSYETLRQTKPDELLIQKLGSNTTESFIKEINSLVERYGYEVTNIESNNIYLDRDSQDLLDEQEEPTRAENRRAAAEIKARQTQIEAIAEAAKIRALGDAKNEQLKKEADILAQFVKDVNTSNAIPLEAKYKHLDKLTTLLENSKGETFDTSVLTSQLLANRIIQPQNQGGNP